MSTTTAKAPRRIIDYFILIREPSHLRATNGYVPEQILVAEKELGRPLTPDEDVVHINGDTQDNRPENLEITSVNFGYRTSQIGEPVFSKARKSSNKSYIPCKFQQRCWKEVRVPKIKQTKQYMPYVCSYQEGADIYKCGIFWKYLDEVRSVDSK